MDRKDSDLCSFFFVPRFFGSRLPIPSPDNCPHPYAQHRPIDEETIAGMRRSILLLISSSIAAPNELPTPFSKSRAMLKSASFFRGYETEDAERRG